MNRSIDADRYEANDAMLKKLLPGLNRLADKLYAMNIKRVQRAKSDDTRY